MVLKSWLLQLLHQLYEVGHIMLSFWMSLHSFQITLLISSLPLFILLFLLVKIRK